MYLLLEELVSPHSCIVNNMFNIKIDLYKCLQKVTIENLTINYEKNFSINHSHFLGLVEI